MNDGDLPARLERIETMLHDIHARGAHLARQHFADAGGSRRVRAGRLGAVGDGSAELVLPDLQRQDLGWTELHARSEDNPFLPREALVEEKRTNSPLIWRQEFEAEFTSLDAAAPLRR
jgi:hypothetical protein